MGQLIQVTDTTVVDDVLVVDTDRSITGQDGSGFAPGGDHGAGLAGQLASRIFAHVDGVDHVWVASSQIVVRRPGGWPGPTREAVTDIIRRFFVFYEETAAASS